MQTVGSFVQHCVVLTHKLAANGLRAWTHVSHLWFVIPCKTATWKHKNAEYRRPAAFIQKTDRCHTKHYWTGIISEPKSLIVTTLHYRCIKGDMIETYKIITGKYQGCVAPSLIKEEIYVTRGNDFRLQTLRVRYDLRKFGFSSPVVLNTTLGVVGVDSLLRCYVTPRHFTAFYC